MAKLGFDLDFSQVLTLTSGPLAFGKSIYQCISTLYNLWSGWQKENMDSQWAAASQKENERKELGYASSTSFSRFFNQIKDLSIIYNKNHLKTLIWKDTCTPMFIAALFTIAKTWKQPKCPTTDMFKKKGGASLVAQWLGVCLLVQGTWVRTLVWEDPTCRGAAGPVSHNCWACASGACAPQWEGPRWWEARAPRWRVAPAPRWRVAPACRSWRRPSHKMKT